MTPSKLFIALFTILTFSNISYSQSREITSASSVEVYKTINDVDLKAWIFNPPDHKITESKPAIVFFFGGGWRTGSPVQFEKHCEYLAARGMVAISVEYRVYSRHGVKANKCVSDAKSAIRWIRQHAGRLGIDPDRIVAAGGSAGGHLAASTALLPDHNDPIDDLSISAIPNALVLFNPVLVLANVSGEKEFSKNLVESLKDRLGATLISMSPYHHLSEGIGPTIIFHGTNDKTVEFRTAEIFNEEMKKKGNPCTLVAYDGEGHGFFNYLRKNNGPFISTLQKLDAFLVSAGYLHAPPIFVIK